MAAALLRIYRGASRMFFSEKSAVRRRAIHTAVWWDVLDCKPPKGCDPSSIAGNITGALAKLNHDGPITFFAFADWDYRVEPQVEEALSATGMKLRQVAIYHNSDRTKYAICNRILLDMLFWARKHPAPANCLIISNDGNLTYALQLLGLRGYNILLAKSQKGPSAMEAAANTLWRWSSLCEGRPPKWTRTR